MSVFSMIFNRSGTVQSLGYFAFRNVCIFLTINNRQTAESTIWIMPLRISVIFIMAHWDLTLIFNARAHKLKDGIFFIFFNMKILLPR